MTENPKPGVWYCEGATVYRLKEVEGHGRRVWASPGVRALENDTLIRITGSDAEIVAEQVLAALSKREA